MGLTTQYLRYVPGSVFGVVGTSHCVRFISKFSQPTRLAVVPACEKVIVWDIKKGMQVLTLDAEVTGTAVVVEPRPPSPGTLDNTQVAVGYSDGTVAVFDLRLGQHIKFSGHRGAVSTLAWDPQGMRLASGSTDGQIVVWDVVSERGVVRLRGHSGLVTRLRFFKTRNILVSSSKDMFIMFWDLDTNHKFRTLAEHNKEVWDFLLLKDDRLLITGSSDENLRVWRLTFNDDLDNLEKPSIDEEEGATKKSKVGKENSMNLQVPTDDKDLSNDASILELKNMGSIKRTRNDRVSGLLSDGRVIACHSKGKGVELILVLTDEEVKSKIAKRLKKEKKRARNASETEAEEVSISEEPQLADEVRKLQPIITDGKLHGIDVRSDRNGVVNLVALHSDNRIVLYNSDPQTQEKKEMSSVGTKLSMVDRPGHRSEIRAVSFNSLSDQIVTASGDSIKVWHRGDHQCVNTLSSDYAVSMAIVPGDRHVLLGTLSGHLQLYNIGSGEMLENLPAHNSDKTNTDTGLWAITLTHDGRGFVTGGSDSVVNFWKFELVNSTEEGKGKCLTFVQDNRALKVGDQVTSLACSSNGRFLAVATLDLKETLYFMDSLKLCHELYGKSLPATCLDFSADCTILVTGSKDTCLRIFGTDFGDQRRLLKNAHQGGVTGVQFISKTHLFFSAGHDGCVKQWDADNFQHIVTLKGHTGIIRCLSVCPKGQWVVSCGQDHSIRLWERTQEPLILDDEREEERTRAEEEDGATATQRPVVPGEDDSANAVRPSVTTHHTDAAADKIIEAIDIYREQLKNGTTPHQLMVLVYKTSDPVKFVLEVLRKVKSKELEEAILILPLDYIIDLLKILQTLLELNWDIELISRVLITALRVNLPQLLNSPKAASVIRSLAVILPKRTQEVQDVIGFNLAGLKLMKNRIEERSENQLFAEATEKVKQNKRRRKKKDRSLKRALLAI